MFDSAERLSQLQELLEELPAFAAALNVTGDRDARPEASSASWLDRMAEATYLVAAADGELAEPDARALCRGLTAVTEGRLSEPRVEQAIERARRKVHEHAATQLLHEIAELVPETALREAVFLVACATIVDRARPSERQSLATHALGHAFGFSEGKIQQLVATLRHSI
ncbi:MAG TPA: hypothetical protein VI072_18835 [Polyangiaceae bacterium]